MGPAQRQHHHARKEQSWPPPGLSAVGPDLEAVIVWIFRLDFSRGVFLGFFGFFWVFLNFDWNYAFLYPAAVSTLDSGQRMHACPGRAQQEGTVHSYCMDST